MARAIPPGAAALLPAAGPGPVVGSTGAVSARGDMQDDVAVGVTSPVFVGRAEQMSAFDDALERVRCGRPAALIIGGEAGVGKSRFLAEFSARARGAGAQVLTGGCLELAQGGLPFAPFTAALRELVRDLGPDGVAQLLGGQGPQELARLLPELGPRTSGPGEGADQDEARARLFEQFLSLFEALAGRGPPSRDDTERAPLVLVIEDLHWAERSSRDLLTFLIRNLPVADGLLIVASYRSDELHRTHPLRPLLADLARDGTVAARSGTADSGRGRLGLTEREFEVLRLVASGQTNREIADQLFISVKTASVHVSNILAKLSASSRVEAATTAHRLHLFDALPA